MSRENEPAAEQAEDNERIHERETPPGRREGEPAAEQARDAEHARELKEEADEDRSDHPDSAG